MNEELYKKKRERLDGVKLEKEASIESAEGAAEKIVVETPESTAEEVPAETPEGTAEDAPLGTAANTAEQTPVESLENSSQMVLVDTNSANQDKETGQRKPVRESVDRRTGRPVVIYILLLFTTALLLMGLSSLVHQRSTLGELGQLRHDLNAMQELQDFQEKIISLQEKRQELEEQIKTMQGDMNGLLAQAQEERGRTEAMQYLYRIQMQYGAGRYQACQRLIEEFEEAGLVENLPRESEDSGILSPLDYYRELKANNAVQITEALAPQTGVVVEEWTPDAEFVPEEEKPEEEAEGEQAAETEGTEEEQASLEEWIEEGQAAPPEWTEAGQTAPEEWPEEWTDGA